MTRPNMHTITYKGITHTLSEKGCQRLVGRSRLFLCKMMQEAADKGIDLDKRMQYAIEQEPGGHRMRREAVAGDGCEGTRKEQFMKKNASLINSALYRRWV